MMALVRAKSVQDNDWEQGCHLLSIVESCLLD